MPRRNGRAAPGPIGDYQLLVLDVMLPGRDGWSILHDLRSSGTTLPVVVLTARDAVRDRVKGLGLGADDYLVKPFAFAELLARVQSVLRRSSGTMPEVVHVADLELDLARQRASRGGKHLDLTPKEFAPLGVPRSPARRTADSCHHRGSGLGYAARRRK